jgi:hypothetical protein
MVWFPLLVTLLFSGVLGCFKVTILGGAAKNCIPGRPRTMLATEDEENGSQLEPWIHVRWPNTMMALIKIVHRDADY